VTNLNPHPYKTTGKIVYLFNLNIFIQMGKQKILN
jgi:hypothetical protein